METRAQSKLRVANPPPRATTAGGTQPVGVVIVASVSEPVKPPSSATGAGKFLPAPPP